MEKVVVCDSSNNRLIMYDIEKSLLKTVHLGCYGESYSSHDFTIDEDKIYVANSTNNNVSIVDSVTFKCIGSFYGGAVPEDVLLVNNYIFVACSGTNSVDVIDKTSKSLLVTIPVRNFPHHIAYSEKMRKLYVTNFIDSSVSIIDIDSLKEVLNIKSKYYPTKTLVFESMNILLCCESCLGDKQGYLEIFNLETLKSECRIQVGKNPLDMCVSEGNLLISNYEEGTISVVDIIERRNIGTIYIGGNLSCINALNDYVYVGDTKEKKISIVNIKRATKRVIALGGEPNAIECLI